MRQETFTTPTPVTLDLRVPAGEIEIQAVAGAGETTVELEPLSGDEAVRAVETAIVELRHDEVCVEVRDDGGWGDTPQVRVAVRCPEGTALAVETASADLRARGAFAAADLETASGDFEVDRVAGELRAKAASGDVTIGSVVGDARIRTASGDVDVECAESSLDVQTASGDQRIGEVARDDARRRRTRAADPAHPDPALDGAALVPAPPRARVRARRLQRRVLRGAALDRPRGARRGRAARRPGRTHTCMARRG